MCGIAGIIPSTPGQDLKPLIQNMTDAIIHRGPDDEGHWVDDTLALGMRRLSIIDLAGGHQPMIAKNGTVIVFNGEIYNYKNLRSDLQDKGHQFQTQSDTEVILNLYLEEGISGIEKLQGMFAISLYDPNQKIIHLVRDRAGIKPLYYMKEDGLVFASELKSLLKGLKTKPTLNKQALWHYLTLRFVPSPDTVWKDIYKLEPGHRLEYDLEQKSCTVKRYWSVEFNAQKTDKTRNYQKEFEDLFFDAVRSRIVAADVPVGVLLSGGLDSSCVAAAIHELGHKNLNSYNISFEDGGDYSEAEYARELADHFGLKFHDVRIDRKSFMEELEELPYHTDEPLADLASIPLHIICKRARKDVTVVLAGEGADEMLLGYDLDQAARWLHQKQKQTDILPPSLLSLVGSLLQKQNLSLMARHGFENIYKKTTPHITSHWSEEEKTALFKEKADHSTQTLLQNWYEKAKGDHPLDHLQQVYMHQWLVEDLLMKADKMSMATSIELRVPFLDHRLIEWASSLPLEWKTGTAGAGFTTKRILRDFAAGRVPERIIKRPKQGFPVPCYSWLQDPDFARQIENRITGSKTELAQDMDLHVFKSLLEDARKGDLSAAHKIWVLLVMVIWAERWT